MSARRVWTDQEIADICAAAEAGEKYAAIGERHNATSRAISGVVFRAGKTRARWKKPAATPLLKPGPPQTYYAHLKPSKTPFAADVSCPDFAWDDRHCEAVRKAAGGFPVMPRRAA